MSPENRYSWSDVLLRTEHRIENFVIDMRKWAS